MRVVVVVGGLRGSSIAVTLKLQPPQYTALPERAVQFQYEKMASPERDKPRSLQKVGFAGTGRAAFPTTTSLRRNGTSRVLYEKMASPERDKHFVNVIHKDLTLPIDKILRKRSSG
jgi:hypothetical protein